MKNIFEMGNTESQSKAKRRVGHRWKYNCLESFADDSRHQITADLRSAGLTTDVATGFGRHRNESSTLATGMPSASIVGGLAVVVSATLIDVVAMDQICLGYSPFPLVLDIAADITAGL